MALKYRLFWRSDSKAIPPWESVFTVHGGPKTVQEITRELAKKVHVSGGQFKDRSWLAVMSKQGYYLQLVEVESEGVEQA